MAASDDLPTEVQARGGPRATSGDVVFVLTVTAGPDAGLVIRLDGSQATRILVGSSPACEMRLGDREVSRRHAALERVGEDLRIRDLGSTNGTFVDRVKVLEADLQGGEYVRVGSTMLRCEREKVEVEAPLTTARSFGRLVGASKEMRRLYPLCEKLAHVTVPVVIEGETGTGKEVLAESLHEMGPRASGPFVVFDCTAVAPNLVEAELFGSERGAFTGAVATRKGIFEQAHGGTLLIDEIGDLDITLQPKLLRALERSEIRRIGGDRWLRVDVRVLAATRRDLDREVEEGRFRDDLFHRIAVARIELPPLRHRQGDIAALATHFWAQLGGDPSKLSSELLERWQAHAWPGNVREMRNTIARVVSLGDQEPRARRAPTSLPPTASPIVAGAADASNVVDSLDRWVESGLPFPQARDGVLEEFEQRFVAKLLAMHGGDVAKAAAASGIGRRYFQMLKARTRADDR